MIELIDLSIPISNFELICSDLSISEVFIGFSLMDLDRSLCFFLPLRYGGTTPDSPTSVKHMEVVVIERT